MLNEVSSKLEVPMNYKDIKCSIEAMIFMAPRSISVSKIYKNLKDITGVDKSTVILQINELVKEYNKRNTSIKIIFENNKVEMVLKPKYIKFNSLAIGTKLSPGELKTLALISLNSPIEQAKIVKRRSYAHLTILKELDLIQVGKKGRKNILSTTKKFNLLYNKKAKVK